MSLKPKLTSGAGWSFEPAGGGKEKPVESLPPEKQRVKITVEKRAKGKTVTAVSGIVLSPEDMKKLAKDLKNACGSGGSSGPDHVEIQGDHREAMGKWLSSKGWMVRL